MLHHVNELAPAKINLSLQVFQKRGDGFHDIESIFQLVPLFDELSAICVPGEPKCIVSVDGAELPSKNTITATYMAFKSVTGIQDGVSVSVKKNIPQGAGLGGGSSDSAAMVRLLCRMFNKILTVDQLMQIAGAVGSDVFFFLLCNPSGSTGCGLVAGRGELVTPIVPRKDLFFVVICPEVHSSTARAYELVDRQVTSGKPRCFPVFSALESIYRMSPDTWTFDNSFTEPLVREYPVIGNAIMDIHQTGALFSQMSGSGASVFGVYSNADAANKACKKLSGKWKFCKMLASS